jgi:chemotaxis family two-component system sensor kinase Cph1
LIHEDLRECDVEPIHIPGAIQPHGVLVALDPGSLTIVEISANCVEYFGREASEVLGHGLTELVGSPARARSVAESARRSSSGQSVVVDLGGRNFDLLAHRHKGVEILEFERHDSDAASTDEALRAALGRLQQPNSVPELCAVAVQAVRQLTGFDRVMMYRFDDDGHGDVVEEATSRGDIASYRGQRFPASDIPRQARAMYLLNWLRLIPDATYTAVPLVADRGAEARSALDLSFATLRSVSPVHLEYLRNMGVRASMSVSIVEGDQLWGLIACHHMVPRHISFAARAACEVIGRVVALQIGAQEELSIRASRESLRGAGASLAAAMRDGRADLAAALTHRGEALLQIAGATGAAVCTAGAVRTVGATPTAAQLGGLLAWLGKIGAAEVLHTRTLAELHAPAAEYAHVASGLLAITLPRDTPSWVLWFRPELVRTVTWAGDPVKPVAVSHGDARLHPRHSFEAWKEVVRGQSRRWSVPEIEAAEDVRRHAIEADLTSEIARAAQAVRLRDEVIAVVSHDLKSPLQVMKIAASLLQPRVAGDERATTMVARIMRAVDSMEKLIHDLLDVAKIESGRFNVTLEPCATSRLVADAIALIGALAEAKQIRLTCDHDGDQLVGADPERVLQVLMNLVGNAIKFTPAGGAVTIETRQADATVRFAVRDTGRGMDEAELAHVFDRYWQARRARDAGAGLGLYIAKGIVEAHGQRLWVESSPGAGSTFYFALPLQPGSQHVHAHEPRA